MPDLLIRSERPSDDLAITALASAAFGPGAYARAAFRVREQAAHDLALSQVGEIGGALVASVRLTPIRVGAAKGLLLGPLVVDAAHSGRGHGHALARHALERARQAGEAFVVLVGDEPYYGPLGFRPIPRGRVRMPGPVDPARLLVAELVEGAAEALEGTIRGDAARRNTQSA